MGKKSVKENKNIYQKSREENGLTREKASEIMQFISPDRIEKIENERVLPRPEEVLEMETCYKNPSLSNYYCTHECPIGIKYIPETEEKTLSQITLEMLNSLNTLDKYRNRFIEITVDGKISSDEAKDFSQIQEKLNDISDTVQSLKLWVEKMKISEKV